MEVGVSTLAKPLTDLMQVVAVAESVTARESRKSVSVANTASAVVEAERDDKPELARETVNAG